MPVNLAVGSEGALNRSELSADYVEFRFDVTEYGAVRNVEVLSEETAANNRQFMQLSRVLRESRFRPLLEEGLPKSSQGHVFRYRYWY